MPNKDGFRAILFRSSTWHAIHARDRDKEKKMTDLEHYTPGPANGARVIKDRAKNENMWTLILVRELRHSPEKVWQSLTDPAQLREGAPFVTDGGLGTAGNAVKRPWAGRPT